MAIDEAEKLKHEDVHKHLEFLQLTITRMAANSFLIKGWSVTLVVGLLAFTLDRDHTTRGALIGLLPAFLFWFLDAYYLYQERLFRRLYDIVRVRDRTDFSLNILDLSPCERKGIKSWLATIFALAIWPFYLTLIAVVVLVWMFNSEPPKLDSPPPATLKSSQAKPPPDIKLKK